MLLENEGIRVAKSGLSNSPQGHGVERADCALSAYFRTSLAIASN